MVPITSDPERSRSQIDRSVLLLFAAVIESLGWATVSLLDEEIERAERIIAGDAAIDQRCEELTSLVKGRISAEDVSPEELQDLITVLQMVPELERSADLAEHIAQRARYHLGTNISPRSRGIIQSMCDAGVRMWQLASRAYSERSRDVWFELKEADDELDNLAGRLRREGAAGADPAVAAELALVARFYERLGDHAVNLARRVDSMVAPKRMSGMRAAAGRRAVVAVIRPWWGAAISRLARLRMVSGNDAFFDLFKAAAANALDCAEELRKLVAAGASTGDHYREIRALERRGDQITVEVLRRLDASLLTPYDRQDIHALAEELDDVVDDIFAAAELLQLVHVGEPLVEMLELTDTLCAMAAEMDSLIRCLRDADGARQHLERIEHLEREGDAIHRRAIAHLFSGDYEALEVLKWKDIVQAVEHSLNTIEDVSDVVESILVKNS